tara:strand:+ start:308 stop:556 length:249 start_codon:yes stop_codon:yes gene_type:complete
LDLKVSKAKPVHKVFRVSKGRLQPLRVQSDQQESKEYKGQSVTTPQCPDLQDQPDLKDHKVFRVSRATKVYPDHRETQVKTQ